MLIVNYRKNLSFVLTVLFIFIINNIVYSDDEELRIKGFCYTVENYINTLVDFTNTKCLAGTGEQKGTIGLILISEKSIFSNEAVKKAWLIVVVGAVGKTIMDNPNLKVDTIIVSDMNMMAKRKAFSFPGILAKNLQQKIYNGEINIEQLYKQLTASLKEYSIPTE